MGGNQLVKRTVIGQCLKQAMNLLLVNWWIQIWMSLSLCTCYCTILFHTFQRLCNSYLIMLCSQYNLYNNITHFRRNKTSSRSPLPMPNCSHQVIWVELNAALLPLLCTYMNKIRSKILFTNNVADTLATKVLICLRH